MKKFKDIKQYTEYLLSMYNTIKFSDNFYKRYKDGDNIDVSKKFFLEKIYDFITFYNKYNTDGIRIYQGEDLYQVSKGIYDKIIDGDLYIDEVLMSPDNILRNVIMLLEIDKYKAEQNTNKK